MTHFVLLASFSRVCVCVCFLQFQSFVQFRGKLNSRTPEEILGLKENQKMWNIHSVLNVLYSLVAKSNINQQVQISLSNKHTCTRTHARTHNVLQLEAQYTGKQPETGEFGEHQLYWNLGCFSLIGLLRLHTQLGDYYLALQCVANVQLSKKVHFIPNTHTHTHTHVYTVHFRSLQ